MKKNKIFLIIALLCLITACFAFYKQIVKGVWYAGCYLDRSKIKNQNNFNSADFGMPYQVPCFKGKFQNPKDSQEWIEYCNIMGANSRSAYVDNCYEEAAFYALREAKIKNEKVVWENAFAICDSYVKNDSEKCKLNICKNIISDDKAIKEICRKEAVKNSSCNDNKKNGSESDIDCGGPDCEACALGKWCWKNEDCKSLACSLSDVKLSNRCVKKCPNGYILDNTPCLCGEYGMQYKEIYDNYYKENGIYPGSLYCCDSKRQNAACK